METFHDDELQAFRADVFEAVEEIIAEDSEQLYREYLSMQRRVVNADRRERREFSGRLRERWNEALDLLALVRLVCLDAGITLQQEHGRRAEQDADYVFLALLRIHARSCLLASEVLALLEAGHASGAFARWRSMHELRVFADFIAKYGQDCAEQYLLHHDVQAAKQAEYYQAHYRQLGYEPMSDAEYQDLQARRSDLLHRFGSRFGSDYGWAAASLGTKATFQLIEEDVGLAWWRPHYLWSSSGVHGGIKGMVYDLAQLGSNRAQMLMLAGPSNAGLADPGHCAAISLACCTIALMVRRVSPTIAAQIWALNRLVKDVGEAFGRAHRKLAEDEARYDVGETSVNEDLEVPDQASE